MNLYGVVQTTYSVPGLVVSFVVEEARPIKLLSLIGWGDTSAEFEVFVDEEPVGGARSSKESRTVQVWWDGQIICNAGQIVEIIATHFSPGLRTLKANLTAARL